MFLRVQLVTFPPWATPAAAPGPAYSKSQNKCQSLVPMVLFAAVMCHLFPVHHFMPVAQGVARRHCLAMAARYGWLRKNCGKNGTRQSEIWFLGCAISIASENSEAIFFSCSRRQNACLLYRFSSTIHASHRLGMRCICLYLHASSK